MGCCQGSESGDDATVPSTHGGGASDDTEPQLYQSTGTYNKQPRTITASDTMTNDDGSFTVTPDDAAIQRKKALLGRNDFREFVAIEDARAAAARAEQLQSLGDRLLARPTVAASDAVTLTSPGVGSREFRYSYCLYPGFTESKRKTCQDAILVPATPAHGSGGRSASTANHLIGPSGERFVLFGVFDGHGLSGDRISAYCRDHMPQLLQTQLLAAANQSPLVPNRGVSPKPDANANGRTSPAAAAAPASTTDSDSYIERAFTAAFAELNQQLAIRFPALSPSSGAGGSGAIPPKAGFLPPLIASPNKPVTAPAVVVTAAPEVAAHTPLSTPFATPQVTPQKGGRAGGAGAASAAASGRKKGLHSRQQSNASGGGDSSEDDAEAEDEFRPIPLPASGHNPLLPAIVGLPPQRDEKSGGGGVDTSGSTATLILVGVNSFHCAYVGDSQAILACAPQMFHSHPARLERPSAPATSSAAAAADSLSHFFHAPAVHASNDKSTEAAAEAGGADAAAVSGRSLASADAEMAKSAKTIEREREQSISANGESTSSVASSSASSSSGASAADRRALKKNKIQSTNTAPLLFNPLPPLLPSTAEQPSEFVIHKLLRPHNFENKSERRRVRAIPGTTLRRVLPATVTKGAAPAASSAASPSKGPLRVYAKGTQFPGLAISRAFGDTSSASVGIIAVPDHSGWTITATQHFIVLASDGVWDQMTPAEVVNFINSYKAPSVKASGANASGAYGGGVPDGSGGACQALVQECASRWLRHRDGMSDDISAIIINLNSAAPNTNKPLSGPAVMGSAPAASPPAQPRALHSASTAAASVTTATASTSSASAATSLSTPLLSKAEAKADVAGDNFTSLAAAPSDS